MAEVWLPYGAQYILQALNTYGFDAYVVGGCVRDSIMRCQPKDWDICTNAKPCEVQKCFSDFKTIDTGLKHGTLTVVLRDGQYEITTFRIDGEYSDNRRPDKVYFTNSLEADLSRRDFKMNAMAYGATGLIDPFDGMSDIRNEVISCVGDPNERFREDALRIMRGLRFASDFGFTIEKGTSQAIHDNKDLLRNIAAERVQSELCKLLTGRRVLNVLLEFSDVISTIIPELAPCVGFEQNNPYHEYTVYDHIAHAVANYKGRDISVKVALLLHDIGKPQCYTEDDRGGHFHGHGVPSRDLANAAMERLRFDSKTKAEVLDLVLYHDSMIEPQPRVVKKWLNKIGVHRMNQLFDVRMADILAHTKGTQKARIDQWHEAKELIGEVLRSEQCFTIKDMAINGSDVMALGVPEGKLVGQTLKHVLDMVINGDIPNEIEPQVEEAEKFLREFTEG